RSNRDWSSDVCSSDLDAYQILLGLKKSYEEFHNVTISDAAVLTAVKSAHRYLTSKNLPDSAIDLLDEASATVQSLVKKEATAMLRAADRAISDGRVVLATGWL